MSETKTGKGRAKLTLKDIREQHGLEIDASDPKQRSRYRRTLDILYACGLKLEETGISDVARGSAVKAAIDYADRTGGKAVTPIEQTIVVHRSVDESAASILEMLGQKRKETEQAQQPKGTTIQ